MSQAGAQRGALPPAQVPLVCVMGSPRPRQEMTRTSIGKGWGCRRPPSKREPVLKPRNVPQPHTQNPEPQDGEERQRERCRPLSPLSAAHGPSGRGKLGGLTAVFTFERGGHEEKSLFRNFEKQRAGGRAWRGRRGNCISCFPSLWRWKTPRETHRKVPTFTLLAAGGPAPEVARRRGELSPEKRGVWEPGPRVSGEDRPHRVTSAAAGPGATGRVWFSFTVRGGEGPEGREAGREEEGPEEALTVPLDPRQLLLRLPPKAAALSLLPPPLQGPPGSAPLHSGPPPTERTGRAGSWTAMGQAQRD